MSRPQAGDKKAAEIEQNDHRRKQCRRAASKTSGVGTNAQRRTLRGVTRCSSRLRKRVIAYHRWFAFARENSGWGYDRIVGA